MTESLRQQIELQKAVQNTKDGVASRLETLLQDYIENAHGEQSARVLDQINER